MAAAQPQPRRIEVSAATPPESLYIADFVCLEAKLIEVDGAQHQGSIADRVRSQHLKRRGFDVVRFSNEEVRADIDAVCAQILRIARMPT